MNAIAVILAVPTGNIAVHTAYGYLSTFVRNRALRYNPNRSRPVTYLINAAAVRRSGNAAAVNGFDGPDNGNISSVIFSRVLLNIRDRASFWAASRYQSGQCDEGYCENLNCLVHPVLLFEIESEREENST